MNKTTVIYHSADYDGIFCREIARKFLPDAELIGWNFGDAKIAMPKGLVYILDLSPECIEGIAGLGQTACIDEHDFLKRIVWIDHHKTSIEEWPSSIRGYRLDGVAACRLAWQWFLLHDAWDPREIYPPYDLPDKQAYLDRKVHEPLAVRLAGEYDVWDKRDPRAETFQYALRCSPITPKGWDYLLSSDEGFALELLHGGEVAQRYAQATDASTCKSRTWLMEWEGLKFLCVNSARFNSLFFAAKDVPETGHDALLGFCFDGKCWTISLYHAKHHTDLDLSEIAKRHGGGGHRGACGFTTKTLPFSL
jgi:uncharacterized protein